MNSLKERRAIIHLLAILCSNKNKMAIDQIANDHKFYDILKTMISERYEECELS